MYATTITRPDAAWPSDKLAEFLLNPSPTHITATNRLITYLYNTRFYAIEHSYDRPDSSKPELAFRCVIDAAFADDTSPRRCTEGSFLSYLEEPLIGSQPDKNQSQPLQLRLNYWLFHMHRVKYTGGHGSSPQFNSN
jgi:hypothetical protein